MGSAGHTEITIMPITVEERNLIRERILRQAVEYERWYQIQQERIEYLERMVDRVTEVEKLYKEAMYLEGIILICGAIFLLLAGSGMIEIIFHLGAIWAK